MENRKPCQAEVEGSWDIRTGEAVVTWGRRTGDREIMSRNRQKP